MSNIQTRSPAPLALLVLACALAAPVTRVLAEDAAPLPAPAAAPQAVAGPQLMAAAQFPAPVRVTADRVTAGSKVLRYEKETRDGKQLFIVTYNFAGVVREATMAEDGTLFSEEEDVDWAMVPAEVRAAAEKYFGRKRGMEAAKVSAQGKTAWEISGRKGDNGRAATFDPTGMLLAEVAEAD